MLSPTKAIGNVGELAIASDLIRLGYDVFFPFGDVSRVDLIALKDNQIIKLQIKTVSRVKNGVAGVGHFKNRRADIRYTTQNIDYIELYVIDRKAVAYIPMAEIEGHRAGFSLRFEEPKNNQKKGVKYFHDYARPFLSVVQPDRTSPCEGEDSQFESGQGDK